MRFIYSLLSLIITILAITSHPLMASGLSPDTVNERIASNITVLIAGSGEGSGVIINQVGDRYTVLTCAHVIRELKGHGVILIGEVQHPFENNAVKMIPGVDLAEIYFEDGSHLELERQNNRQPDIGNTQLIKRSTSEPEKGDIIYIAGWEDSKGKVERAFTKESNYSFTSGKIISKNQKEKDGYEFKYTNKTVRGMSGGPILNQNGELIGIHGKAGGGIPISRYPKF